MLPSADVCDSSKPRTDTVLSLDHIELYVTNARQAAHFYWSTLGLPVWGYAGFETGAPDQSSYALAGGDIRLLLRSVVDPDGPVGRHVGRHGDGVHDIALRVTDAEDAFHRAVKAGATPLLEPRVTETDAGRITVATIRAFGDVVHSLVQRDGDPWWMPGFEQRPSAVPVRQMEVTAVDHLAICLSEGCVDAQVELYRNAFGLRESYDDYVETENSAMRGRIVENVDARLRLPLWEAGKGPRQSQVNEFVQFNAGPGVQHIGFLCADIVAVLEELRERGVEFVRVPDIYYSAVLAPQEEFTDQCDVFRKLGIVVDRDPHGYLLQAFTKPLQSRPTLFWEIIERRGARSFGGGNIRKLFEAIEREQEMRGTL